MLKTQLLKKFCKIRIFKKSKTRNELKVIILDERKVITGSFNFTKSADTRNAENVIIVNDKEVASKYLQNWFSRKAKNASTR